MVTRARPGARLGRRAARRNRLSGASGLAGATGRSLASSGALSSFTPRVREWFEPAFAAPTPAQAQAWPAIARGEHVLLSAPTGSGKTLAAFLWALDRLSAARAPGAVSASDAGQAGPAARGTRVVYVSPLKALAYDIERNLRAPLRGNRRPSDRARRHPHRRHAPARARGDAAQPAGHPDHDARVAVPDAHLAGARDVHRGRGGDRRRDPRGRRHQARLAPGAHARAPRGPGARRAPGGHGPADRPVARHRIRSRRSAAFSSARTARSRSSTRARRSSTCGSRCRSSRWPNRSAAAGRRSPRDPLEPVAGGESTRGSIWPAIYPELLRLVREHNSTIVFVNNRRSAERVALRLNELAAANARRRAIGAAGRDRACPPRLAGARGAHEGRGAAQGRRAACLVATSSLELGIDMGAVDLVLQIESPKSVARGLQRIGRAGHGVGEVSRGRIFPKFRGDLLECAVVVAAHARRPDRADRRAAQRAGRSRSADCRDRRCGEPTAGSKGRRSARSSAGVSVDELYALVTSTHSYAELSRELLENVLDMLDGRYPSQGVRRAARAHRLGPRRRHDPRAQGRAPARGRQRRHDPRPRPLRGHAARRASRRRARRGDGLRGAPRPGVPARRLHLADRGDRPRPRDRHARARRTRRGAVLEGRLASGARRSWAKRSARSRAGRSSRRPRRCERDYDLDPRAARNLLDYLREQQAATRVLPSERTIVVERFRDEIGDWRLCILSPYGGRVHSAWALALTARIRERFELEADAISSDDGIVLHLPDLDADDVESLPSAAELRADRARARSSRPSPPSSAARRCSVRAFARTPAGRC